MAKQNRLESLRDPDMITSSGKSVYFDKPEETEIVLEDFELPLKNICRYNGHAKWSLLQHLAFCVCLVPVWYPEAKKESLAAVAFHDLHEVIVGDVVSGLKKFIPKFYKLEEKWAKHIAKKLGLLKIFQSAEQKEIVKFIDYRALQLEMYWLEHKGFSYVIGDSPTPNDLEIKILQHISVADSKLLWQIVSNALKLKPIIEEEVSLDEN